MMINTHSTKTDQPGFYHATIGNVQFDFCVNVAASESKTTPFSTEEFEQRGVRLGSQSTHAEEIERLRQLHNLELEDRQKVWRWTVLLVVFGTDH